MKNQMKSLLIAAGIGVTMLLSTTANAQNVSISATGVAPNNDAGLDVNFTDKGLLIPRVNISNLTTFNPPITSGGNTTSLLVYNTNTTTGEGYYYWDGAKWVKLLVTGTPSDAWLTLGNAGTNPTTHFLGTTDNVDLVFRTNNIERMRITNNGNVGIGTTTPSEKLEILGGGIQLNDTLGIGFNGEIPYNGNVSNNLDAAKIYYSNNDASWTGDPITDFLVIEKTDFNHTSPDGGIVFTNKGSNNQRVVAMTIRGNSRVGIGTTTPQRQFHVYGNSNPNLIRVQSFSGGVSGTAGIEFVSAPLGSSNEWRPGYIVSGDNGGFTGRLDFYTNGTGSGNKWSSVLGMSIVNGNVGIGTNTPNAQLEVRGSAILNNTLADGARLVWMGGSGGTQEYRARVSTIGNLEFFPGELTPITLTLTQNNRVGIGITTPGGQLELSLDEGRKPSTNTWTIVSDKRLKRIVGNYQKGLKEILSLQPVEYYYVNSENRKFDERVLNTKNVGFIAQEVQKIFPECVGEDEDGYLNFNIHAILVAFVNAIKEQQEQIEELKKENNELKTSLQQQNQILQAELQKIKTHIDIGEAKK